MDLKQNTNDGVENEAPHLLWSSSIRQCIINGCINLMIGCMYFILGKW
jgi:hypothetical protein